MAIRKRFIAGAKCPACQAQDSMAMWRENNIDIVENPVLAKEQFGYVPDSPDMFLRLTGMEYLNLMGDIYGVSSEDRKLRIKDMSERFEMNSALGDKIQSYSHGMRQKI